MAETRVTYQAGFAELGVVAEVAGDIQERCRVMLLEEPETREDYTVAYVRYLARYCGLDEAMKPWWGSEDLLAYLQRWPSYRTVANRCQDLMRADASLKPSREVEEERQRQRRQGRVR